MSSEERIAAVLREHAFVVDPSISKQPLRRYCQEGRCDEQGHMLQMEIQEHPAHVAAAVLSALNLTEEREVRNEYAARNGAPLEAFRRLVTPWEEA